jgi:hypothetical protein
LNPLCYGTRAETRRIADLLVRYEIMEPPKLVEDTRSTYTNKFWEFKRGFFDGQVIKPRPKLRDKLQGGKVDVDKLAALQISVFIYLWQLEQEHQQQQKIDFTEYEKWVKSLQPELEEQINDMTKIVSGFDKAHLDAIYASEYKLYDKMVELNILQTNGKLTAEFKNYFRYCYRMLPRIRKT